MIAVAITAKGRRSTLRVGSAGITVASGFGAGAVLAGLLEARPEATAAVA